MLAMPFMDVLSAFGIMHNYGVQEIIIILMTSATVLITITIILRRMKPIYNPTDKLIPLVIVSGCDTGLGYSIIMRYLNGNGNQNNCKENISSVFKSENLIPNKFALVAFVLNPSGAGATHLIKQSLKNNKIELFVEKLDLTNSDSIKNATIFVDKLLEKKLKTGHLKYKLQALINNAASMVMGDFEWQTPQMISEQFQVNILGPIMLTAQLLPKLRRDKSRVINVISHCGFMPLPGISIYGATKASLNAWTMSSRVELKYHGIRMITFSPGNFCINSSILNSQRRARNFNKMRKHLSKEQLTYYCDYLNAYEHFLNSIDEYINSPECTTIPNNNKIYSYMDNAIWNCHPKLEYCVPDPLRYKFYFALTRTLSLIGLHNLKDQFLQQFVSTPNFKNYSSYLKNNVQ